MVAATVQWVAALDPGDPRYDRYRLEALYVFQGTWLVGPEFLGFHAVVRQAQTPELRAAAIHVLSDGTGALPAGYIFTRIAGMTLDPHPRVRLQAVRALSSVETLDSVKAVLRATDRQPDDWPDFTLKHTLAALDGVWRPGYDSGELAKSARHGEADRTGIPRKLNPEPTQLGSAPENTGEIDRQRRGFRGRSDEAHRDTVEDPGASSRRTLCV